MTKRSIPLYLITGFLGAGKTTFLNNLLGKSMWKKTGVLVNDFGTVNIDSTRIASKDDIITAEVSGGQIFCACVSGNFVEAMVKLSQVPVDALIVETSGLAKPAPMEEIIHWSQEKSGDAFDYRGMICVIDASTFPILSETVNAVSEQLAYSDLFIVNKCDLVEQQDLDAIDRTLGELYPDRVILHTVNSAADPQLIHDFHSKGPIMQEDPSRFLGWGLQGRPYARLLTQSEPVSSDSAYTFLKAAGSSLYRIKGYISTTDKGLMFADCVGEQIDLKVSDIKEVATGLMCIAKRSKTIRELPALWEEHTETQAGVEEV